VQARDGFHRHSDGADRSAGRPRLDRVNGSAGALAERDDVRCGPDLAHSEGGDRGREICCRHQLPHPGLAQAQQFDQFAQGENCGRVHGADLTTRRTDRPGQCSNRAVPRKGTNGSRSIGGTPMCDQPARVHLRVNNLRCPRGADPRAHLVGRRLTGRLPCTGVGRLILASARTPWRVLLHSQAVATGVW
jgi:hypothetical protein